MRTLKWFTNRVKKRVYRNDCDCGCTTCSANTKKGLVIRNKKHAEYLYNIQFELNLLYRDTKNATD